MTVELVTLNQIGNDEGDASAIGGKGVNLGRLLQAGFPVPPGFVVPASACKLFFLHIQLERYTGKLQDVSSREREQLCARIRAHIRGASMPEQLIQKIFDTYDQVFPDSRRICAVRSSATAEDSRSSSFAGQHETYYYIQKDQLPGMIKSCWASLWNHEAVSYRIAHGFEPRSALMAVIVQEMIESDVSGITFTAHPVTGSKEEIVTESGWGMGAAIVDGRVTPDHYVLTRDGLNIRGKKINEKRFMVPPKPLEGTDIRLCDVPRSLRLKETLTDEQARQVTQWALKAETLFGSPQDVEWAIFNDSVYILQSRPITVMGREEVGKGLKGKLVIFKPLLENFTEPLTPLTGDLLSIEAPYGVWLIQGWCYVDIRPLRLFFPYRLTDKQFADLIYDIPPEFPPMKLSFWRVLLFLISFTFGYFAVGLFFVRTRNMPEGFLDGFRELCREVEQDPRYGISAALSRLWSWSWKKFFDPMSHMPLFANVSSLRYIGGMQVLRKLLRRWVPGIRTDAADLLCSGAEGILSTEMGREIWQLARTARAEPDISDLLKREKVGVLWDALKKEPKGHAFLEQLNGFLAKHGHRALREMELRSPRWEEDPAMVLGMVRNYLSSDYDPGVQQQEMGEARSNLEKEIHQTLAGKPLEKLSGFRWRLIRWLVNGNRYFIKLRENSRFYHIMALNPVRKKILEVEASLMKQGKLKCKDDIFFLKRREVAQLESGALEWLDVEARIRERRLEQVRLSRMTPPRRIGIEDDVQPRNQEEGVSKSRLLRGSPASPGLIEGVAHVIMDPSVDMDLKPGEILVAPYTDPAWTPLFLIAGAAVVEVGSFLSHAGTVAREFGMPCVVGVSDCTRLIRTGMRLRVDGDGGRVVILNGDVP